MHPEQSDRERARAAQKKAMEELSRGFEQQRAEDTQEQLVLYVAESLEAGIPNEKVSQNLVDLGFTPEDAAAFVGTVRGERKSEGLGSIVFGAILIAVGLGITYATMLFAPGGVQVVTWGLVLVGAWQVLSGIVRFLSR